MPLIPFTVRLKCEPHSQCEPHSLECRPVSARECHPSSSILDTLLPSGPLRTAAALACGLNIARSALDGDQQSSPACGGTGHVGPLLRPFGTPCSARERRPSRQSSPPSREA